jgi:GNAT superfamily N-acetyltransferase
MASDDEKSYSEIEIALQSVIVVQSEDYFDDYSDNYVRRHRGPIRLLRGEPERIEEIGEIDLWYLDGSRAVDNGLDIVAVCDSIGPEEHEYASSIYKDSLINETIVEQPMSQDVLVLHSLSILPEHRGNRYGLLVTRKIMETIGYHCGAVLFKPAPLQFSPRAEDMEWVERMAMDRFPTGEKVATEKLLSYWKALEIRVTKNPEIYCIIH